MASGLTQQREPGWGWGHFACLGGCTPRPLSDSLSPALSGWEQGVQRPISGAGSEAGCGGCLPGPCVSFRWRGADLHLTDPGLSRV